MISFPQAYLPCNSALLHKHHMPHPSHSSGLDHLNIWWKLQTIELLVMQSSPLAPLCIYFNKPTNFFICISNKEFSDTLHQVNVQSIYTSSRFGTRVVGGPGITYCNILMEGWIFSGSAISCSSVVYAARTRTHTHTYIYLLQQFLLLCITLHIPECWLYHFLWPSTYKLAKCGLTLGYAWASR